MNNQERQAEVSAAMTSHLRELEDLLSELMPNDESERQALEQSVSELRQIIYVHQSQS